MEIKAELKLLNDRFSCIEKTFNITRQGDIVDPELKLPLKTIQDLEDFEQKLLEDNFYKQAVSINYSVMHNALILLTSNLYCVV